MNKRNSEEKIVKLLQNAKCFKKLVENQSYFQKIHMMRPKARTQLRTSMLGNIKSTDKVYLNLKAFKLKNNYITKNKLNAGKKQWRNRLKTWKSNLQLLNRKVADLNKENQQKEFLSKLVSSSEDNSLQLESEISNFLLKKRKMKRNHVSLPNNLLDSFTKEKTKKQKRNINFEGFRVQTKVYKQKRLKAPFKRFKSESKLNAKSYAKAVKFPLKLKSSKKPKNYFQLKSRGAESNGDNQKGIKKRRKKGSLFLRNQSLILTNCLLCSRFSNRLSNREKHAP